MIFINLSMSLILAVLTVTDISSGHYGSAIFCGFAAALNLGVALVAMLSERGN